MLRFTAFPVKNLDMLFIFLQQCYCFFYVNVLDLDVNLMMPLLTKMLYWIIVHNYRFSGVSMFNTAVYLCIVQASEMINDSLADVALV